MSAIDELRRRRDRTVASGQEYVSYLPVELVTRVLDEHAELEHTARLAGLDV